MLKLLFLTLMLLLFSGCADMTGIEMATKIKECTDNNLTYRVFVNGLNNRINDIQCVPYDAPSTKLN